MSGAVVLGVTDGLIWVPVVNAAAALASRTGRALRIVHVHTGPHGTWDGDAGVRTEVYLHRTAPWLSVDRACAVGDPAQQLLDAVEPDGVVVLGDRRSRPGALAGHTLVDVVDRAACPVLVMPEYRLPAGGAPRRGGVVAALDGGRADEAVLATAADAAAAGPAPLEILDAAPDPAGSTEGLLARVPLPPEVLVTRSTTPFDEALAVAARGARLVVVGLSPSGRAGSAGVGLLALACCPVLLVADERLSRAATRSAVAERAVRGEVGAGV